MKIYQYFNMVLCSFIVFIFVFVISGESSISFIIAICSFPVFVSLKKKMNYHDTKVDMDNIKKYYDERNDNSDNK